VPLRRNGSRIGDGGSSAADADRQRVDGSRDDAANPALHIILSAADKTIQRLQSRSRSA